MWEDPIVADVHRIREKLAAEYGFDVQTIFADLRQRQAALGGRLVSPRKRVEPTADADWSRDFGSPDSMRTEAAQANEMAVSELRGQSIAVDGGRTQL